MPLRGLTFHNFWHTAHASFSLRLGALSPSTKPVILCCCHFFVSLILRVKKFLDSPCCLGYSTLSPLPVLTEGSEQSGRQKGKPIAILWN